MGRLSSGGRIDRTDEHRFTFNGRTLWGFAGDTLASALVANDVGLVGRSFKYHRPRGLIAAGEEEPNALVQLGEGAWTEPNIKATRVELYDGLVARSVNCWPSATFDVGALAELCHALLPAGFYYKTFMGGPGWPVVIALIAFVTIVTAVLSRDDATDLVLALAAGTVVTCWMVITFSFALQYARRDIEQGGLKFPGSAEPVFSDYVYLAIGCSATFGTTDTTIVSSPMRKLISVHSVLGLLLNTVVVAVLISIIVS